MCQQAFVESLRSSTCMFTSMQEIIEKDTRFFGKTFLNRVWSMSLWDQMLVDQASYPSIYMHQWMFIKLNALFLLYPHEHASMYD